MATEKAFLVKYGEIALKGKNRRIFEDVLVRKVKDALAKTGGEFAVSKTRGRIFVEALSEIDEEETVAALQRGFGIIGICPVALTSPKEMKSML